MGSYLKHGVASLFHKMNFLDNEPELGGLLYQAVSLE